MSSPAVYLSCAALLLLLPALAIQAAAPVVRVNSIGFLPSQPKVATNASFQLWVLAELWEATGNPGYLQDFQTQAGILRPNFEAYWDWGNLKKLGFLTYLFSSRPGRDPLLVESLRGNLFSAADGMVRTRPLMGKAVRWATVTGGVATEPWRARRCCCMAPIV